ncbi:MAG: nucleotide exchange factor GrpE [Paludibacter sp. 47-17]|nr:MAG: nucleotide exchange factor GrpE [Paludibacter sp. 47-17]
MKKKVSEETKEQKEPVAAEQETSTEQHTPSDGNASTDKAAEGEAIDELKQEIADLKDKNLRLMAEFDNFRKRTLKEKSELILNGGEDVLKKLLPLVDDFERALKAMETSTDAQALKEGLDLIYAKLISYLNENGVQAIPTENEVFNTDLHEAITTFPAPSDDMKGKIVDCISKGYTLREKVIRYSKVVVGE